MTAGALLTIALSLQYDMYQPVPVLSHHSGEHRYAPDSSPGGGWVAFSGAVRCFTICLKFASHTLRSSFRSVGEGVGMEAGEAIFDFCFGEDFRGPPSSNLLAVTGRPVWKSWADFGRSHVSN